MAVTIRDTLDSQELGIHKSIDAKSQHIALDILQKGLYAFPIRSTVRELASNSVDSIVERDYARAILLEQAKIEDHYDLDLQGDDGIYHSSSFKPDYYDLNWLDTETKAQVIYEEVPQDKGRDLIRFIDSGVGLGGDRLIGYCQLNYSSKRANKDTLGKWGLGSKVALSLGVDSFKMISYYNGKKITFNVYSDKVDSITPKFGVTGLNPSYTIMQKVPNEDGTFREVPYTIYYEPTTHLNGVEIQVEVKQVNRKLFSEAIESQLLYFQNIEFYKRSEGSVTPQLVDFKAKILYEDDDIIISDNKLFDKPHILLGAGKTLVNYGPVAHEELEMEVKSGSVGLKMSINDIDVTPSREAPVWSTKTREAVDVKYKKIIETAEKYISDSLAAETNLYKWFQKAIPILSTTATSGVLAQFAKIIDMKSATINFNQDKTIKARISLAAAFGAKVQIRVVSYNDKDQKITRLIPSINDFIDITNVFLMTKQDAKCNAVKDLWIRKHYNCDKFIVIAFKDDVIVRNLFKEVGNVSDIVWSRLLVDIPLRYEDIIVPDDFKSNFDDEGEEVTDVEGASTTTVSFNATKNRFDNEKFLLHKVKGIYSDGDQAGDVYTSSVEQDINTFVKNSSLNSTSINYKCEAGDRELASFFLHVMPNIPESIYDESNTNKYFNWSERLSRGKLLKNEVRVPFEVKIYNNINIYLIGTENDKFLKEKGLAKHFSSIAEQCITYDKKTGVLEVSPTVRDSMAIMYAVKFFRDLVTEKHMNLLPTNSWNQSGSLVDDVYRSLFLSSADAFSDNIKAIQGLIYRLSIASYQVKNRTKSNKYEAFLDLLVSYELSPNDAALELINSSVPDGFCDIVDEIKDVKNTLNHKLYDDLCKYFVALKDLTRSDIFSRKLMLETPFKMIEFMQIYYDNRTGFDSNSSQLSDEHKDKAIKMFKDFSFFVRKYVDATQLINDLPQTFNTTYNYPS